MTQLRHGLTHPNFPFFCSKCMHCGLLSGDPVGISTKTSNLRQGVTKIRLSKKSNYKQLNVQIWSPKEIQRRPRLLIKKPKCTGGVTQTCSGFDTLFATPYHHQLAKHRKTCSEARKKRKERSLMEPFNP